MFLFLLWLLSCAAIGLAVWSSKMPMASTPAILSLLDGLLVLTLPTMLFRPDSS